MAFCGAIPVVSAAQLPGKSRWGLTTNALEDVALFSPNLHVNLYVGQRSVFTAGGGWGWWGQKWQKSFQQWNLGAQYHFYLENDGRFLGHFVGAGFASGQRERHKNNDGTEGQWATAGVLYGYTWHLKRHWFLSADVGVGYSYSYLHKFYYDDYDKDQRYHCHSHEAKHGFGLTSLSVSFNYRF